MPSFASFFVIVSQPWVTVKLAFSLFLGMAAYLDAVEKGLCTAIAGKLK